MTRISVRMASGSDAPFMVQVERAAAHTPWGLAAVESHIHAKHGVALVLCDGSMIVAHVLATALLDEGEILTIAVRPSHRRRGHARQLLKALAAEWRQKGVGRGFLEVRDDNCGARALYAAEGWRPMGQRANYYSDGTDAVLLSWEAS